MTETEKLNSVIENVAGSDVLPLVEVLKGKTNVSEFTLAEELKSEINTVRNMLYRLYDSNLVKFTRKKDKKKGWYIYYWTFVPSRLPRLSKVIKQRRAEKLKERLQKEKSTNYFSCGTKCLRLGFEQAIDYQFKCPECGDLMNQEDTSKRVIAIEKEIKHLEIEIKKIPDVIEEEPLETLEDLDTEIIRKDEIKVKIAAPKKKPKPVKKAVKKTTKKVAKKTKPKKKK